MYMLGLRHRSSVGIWWLWSVGTTAPEEKSWRQWAPLPFIEMYSLGSSGSHPLPFIEMYSLEAFFYISFPASPAIVSEAVGPTAA